MSRFVSTVVACDHPGCPNVAPWATARHNWHLATGWASWDADTRDYCPRHLGEPAP